MIILRTHPEHIPLVVERSMHALARSPTISPGDLILISLAIAKTKDGLPPIRYAMEFVKIRADRTGETSREIWGKKWPYVLYGQGCRQLNKPFDIRDHQVSGHNYGQGGPFVYVEPSDEAVLWQRGLLA
mgnify:CR=1 FL=1